jgi:hypothetical protein
MPPGTVEVRPWNSTNVEKVEPMERRCDDYRHDYPKLVCLHGCTTPIYVEPRTVAAVRPKFSGVPKPVLLWLAGLGDEAFELEEDFGTVLRKLQGTACSECDGPCAVGAELCPDCRQEQIAELTARYGAPEPDFEDELEDA